MELGNHEGSYFSEEEEFKPEMSQKSLELIISAYKRCCRTLHYSEKVAIRTLCPHDLARAKRLLMKKESLEVFLRVLTTTSQDHHDGEALFDYFDSDKEDWSVILKEKTSQ